MNDVTQKARSVAAIVESVVLAMSVGLMLWLANVVIAHGNVLSAHSTQIEINTSRLTVLETSGTPGLRAHETEDNTRIGAHAERIVKLENALLVLQATPGTLQGLIIEIRGLREGQARIEKALETHKEKTEK